MARSKTEYEVVKDGEVLATTKDEAQAQQLAHNFNGAQVREAGAGEGDADD